MFIFKLNFLFIVTTINFGVNLCKCTKRIVSINNRSQEVNLTNGSRPAPNFLHVPIYKKKTGYSRFHQNLTQRSIRHSSANPSIHTKKSKSLALIVMSSADDSYVAIKTRRSNSKAMKSARAIISSLNRAQLRLTTTLFSSTRVNIAKGPSDISGRRRRVQRLTLIYPLITTSRRASSGGDGDGKKA